MKFINPSFDDIASGFTKTINQLENLINRKQNEIDLASVGISSLEEVRTAAGNEQSRAKALKNKIEKLVG